MTIEVRDVDVTIDRTHILRGVTCAARPGEFTGVIGPNGSGKSTLLSLLTRWRQPDSGQVLLNGRDVRSIGRREFARTVAEVEQQSATVLELTVEQIVELGTIPHGSGWGRPLGHQSAAVDDALAVLDIGALRERAWHTLSGGERQKVQVARALAQRPDVLILDEPTNHLDVAAGLHLLSVTQRLGLTVVAAIHDLNLAAMFCDRLVVLQDGAVCAQGAPADVLTPDLLAGVYGIDARILRHPTTGGPLIVPCATVDAPAAPQPVATRTKERR